MTLLESLQEALADCPACGRLSDAEVAEMSADEIAEYAGMHGIDESELSAVDVDALRAGEKRAEGRSTFRR